MTTGEGAPFELHGSGWYKEPLDYEVVIYETDHENHVATVTMNRPERMNALSHQLRAELFHAIKVAERDNEINVIILKARDAASAPATTSAAATSASRNRTSVRNTSAAATGPAT